MSQFLTFREPVVKNSDNTIKPLYDLLLDFDIPNNLFKRHYVQKYHSKFRTVFDSSFPLNLRLSFLLNKLLLRDVYIQSMFVEVTVKNNTSTRHFIDAVVGKPGVELVDTPEDYWF